MRDEPYLLLLLPVDLVVLMGNHHSLEPVELLAKRKCLFLELFVFVLESFVQVS